MEGRDPIFFLFMLNFPRKDTNWSANSISAHFPPISQFEEEGVSTVSKNGLELQCSGFFLFSSIAGI